jgi:hypothetical protein
MPRRRARAQLFSPSGRHLVIVLGLAAAALLGLGVLTQRVETAAPLGPLSWIGQ